MRDDDASKEEHRLWMGRQMAAWKRDAESDMRGMQNANWMDDKPGPPPQPIGYALTASRPIGDGLHEVTVQLGRRPPAPRRSWWLRLKGLFEPEGMK